MNANHTSSSSQDPHLATGTNGCTCHNNSDEHRQRGHMSSYVQQHDRQRGQVALDVAVLNNMGVDCLEKGGMANRAREYFRRALSSSLRCQQQTFLTRSTFTSPSSRSCISSVVSRTAAAASSASPSLRAVDPSTVPVIQNPSSSPNISMPVGPLALEMVRGRIDSGGTNDIMSTFEGDTDVGVGIDVSGVPIAPPLFMPFPRSPVVSAAFDFSTMTSIRNGSSPSPQQPSSSSTTSWHSNISHDNNEYDEGMSTYECPMRIDVASCFDYQRVAPIILFNLGRLRVSEGKHEAASECFQRALEIIRHRVQEARAGGNGSGHGHGQSAEPPHSRLGDDACSASNSEGESDEAVKNKRASAMHLSDDECCRAPYSKIIKRDGPVAEDAIPILHNLGRIHYRASRYRAAIAMYARALRIATDANPDGNGESRNLAAASALNCMGVLLFHLSGNNGVGGDRHDSGYEDKDNSGRECEKEHSTQAMAMFRRSLSIRRNVLTEQHVDVATTINNIGRVNYMLGEHAEARVTYVRALTLRTILLPTHHLDLAATMYNLGQTYHQLGDLDKAMELYRGFYRAASVRLGPNHRDVTIILKCMAQVHQDRNEYDRASELYQRSLHATKCALGDRHPEVASTLNKMGNLYYEMSDFDSAIRVYEEGLGVERCVLDPVHPNIVVTLTNIAQSHKHRGQLDSALQRYIEANAVQRRILGPNDPRLVPALSNVAQVSCRLGQYPRALDAYQELLRIRVDAYGDDHLDVASTLNSIGLVLFKQGLHRWAIDSFSEALRIRRLRHGSHHRDVAVVLYNIATTHLKRGDDDAAMALYRETLRVERSAMGPDVAMTLRHVGHVHHRRGELQKALVHYEEVLEIERRVAAAEDAKVQRHGWKGDDCAVATESFLAVARSLNRIGNIHLQKGNVSKMMTCFAEAMRIFAKAAAPSLNLRGPQPSSSSDQNHPSSPVETGESNELDITGYNFYGLSVLHPECAAAA